MEYYVYDHSLLKFIQNNSGETIKRIKELYLIDEPKGIITGKKASFDSELDKLVQIGSVTIENDKVIFNCWPKQRNK